MDLNKDYTSEIIRLEPDYEGDVVAVLTSSKFNVGKRKSVLYLHGFVDYFFHPHLGEKFNQSNYDFFALDLRKYGRSLLEHQHPNYCKDLEEYFEEISIAISKISNKSTSVLLMAHSTGGLIASYYLNYGKEKGHIDGLILNSPFLDFNQTKFVKMVSQFAAKLISKVSDYAKIDGALSPVYAKSLHKDYYGSWDFNLNWKPIEGFPTYFKWIVAIARAQQKLENSNIKIPVLVMYSSGSIKTRSYSEKVMRNDIVLDIEDIKRVGKTLGTKVTLLSVKNAQHDIFLSPKTVREDAFNHLFSWLEKMDIR